MRVTEPKEYFNNYAALCNVPHQIPFYWPYKDDCQFAVIREVQTDI